MRNLKALDQRGMGIIGVIVAAALVVVAALTVANFITDQNKRSISLEVSGSCQNIANSVVEYIKKDETSLFISSYGPAPGTTRYASGLDKTDDGLDRYKLGNNQAPLFMGPSSFQMSIPNGNQELPGNWRYFNHLNIKNSANRLLLLAANGDFCCASLDMSNPNCGARFIDNSISRPGFQTKDKNIEIDLAVNFPLPNGNSLCGTKRRLSLTDNTIPGSTYRHPVDFKVQVTVAKGTPQEKICEAHGKVQKKADVTASLTLLQLDNHSALCGSGKIGLPSHCSARNPVSFKIKTVRSSSGSNCQSQCLSQIQSRTCNNLGSLNLFNSFSHSSCVNNCLESEPGSSFLCKIGEKNWFNNIANANRWEPCERTRVYDYDGSVAGNVSIVYLPVFNDTRSEITTNATITLSNLKSERAYVVDVRSIDTQGNIGPSFCSTSPSSCDTASNPHFVVSPGIPTVGSMTEVTNHVAPVSRTTQVGRNNIITSQAKYASALNPFGTNLYQCESGAPKFSVPISYSVPPGAYGNFTSDYCTGTLTTPSGTVNIPRGSGIPGCVCSAGNCTASLPASTVSGNYKFDMTIQNDCGTAGITKTQNWCTDNNTNINIGTGPDRVFGPTPDFDNHISYPTLSSKACGVVTLCPRINGTFVPTIGPCPNAIIGWNAMTHSGCLQDPNNNYCALVLDPCGRFQSSRLTKYSTTLVGVSHTSGTPVNMCYSFGGNQVGGNHCETGAYCSDTGKCFTTCETPPCPTNNNTPAANDCGPRYCPVLNSCPVMIGSPSSTSSCSAQPPWSCPGCVWTSGPNEDIGCNIETCSGYLGKSCSSPTMMCCNGTPGKRKELICK